LDRYREWKKIEFPKKYFIRIWKTTRLRGRPRSRWQDEVREDGRLVGEKGGRKAYITEELKRLLRMARNRCILHMPME